jgi:hypothetical protein
MQHVIYHTIDTYLGKNITNYVHNFQKTPNLKPHYSSLSVMGHPRAGTKLHLGKGIPNQDDVS